MQAAGETRSGAAPTGSSSSVFDFISARLRYDACAARLLLISVRFFGGGLFTRWHEGKLVAWKFRPFFFGGIVNNKVFFSVVIVELQQSGAQHIIFWRKKVKYHDSK